MGFESKYPMKEQEIKTFECLGFNDKYRVRLIRNAKNDIQLDVREYLDTPDFTGFTRKGIRLGWDDIQGLKRILPEIEEIMDKDGVDIK